MPRKIKRDEEGNIIGFEEFPPLETKWLVLGRMTIEDAEFYFDHFSDPEVAPSTRLLGRLGFSQEDVLRDYTHLRGKYLNGNLLSLLRRDWERRMA